MHADDFFRLYAPREMSFNQATLTSAELARAEPEVTKPDGAAIPDGAVFLIPIGLMTVWAIFAFRLSDAWKVARTKTITIKHYHQVSCRNCRYFTNNPYLKCALHPSTALTPEAINCSDYCPQNERS